MRWLNDYRMKLVLVGFVAAFMLGGGRAKAEIIMSEPTNPGPGINNDRDVQECDISHDGLELYYAANRTGGYGGWDLWVSKRETLDSTWQEPVNLGPLINTSEGEVEPSISGDGLELYFVSAYDWGIIRVCRRASKDTPWGSPAKIGPPLGSNEDIPPVGSNDAFRPDISADGLSLYFNSTRVGGYGGTDIWMSTRATIDDEWSEPVNLGPNVNSSSDDYCPCISTDGLTLLFDRGYRSMWGTTRRSINDDWGPAVQLAFKNPPGNFFGPSLSSDGATVYFEATPAWGGYGNNDILQVKFIPIVDFDNNGIVDAADMCIMIDNWHTDNPLCDIAPLPLGDGIVDVQDLIVLAEHLFEDYRLIAHWKLDEEVGSTAYDSLGMHDGTLHGEPIWLTAGGRLDGALQFDGIDDYISTDFILDPSLGPFSVFAWIQGGGPGQVIISQLTGAGNIWLGLDSQSGTLMTGLVPPSTGWTAKKPLVSEFIITNDQWHYIGFLWDGSYRILYVDGIEVA